MKRIGAILLTIGILAALGKVLGLDPQMPPPPTAKKVAVYVRTLWPTPPPLYVVVNKRTSLSGEGEFKFKPLSSAHLK